ncbi:TspO/MBR family-domain-containing protein [Flagelloscypha sp. PMI_526]|nr:TspO/MBR family-domain-containing protein [Flagelloscypha sp. PMI_526]
MPITLPSFLIDIPRNPGKSMTALGLPLLLGVLSGSPTAKVVKGPCRSKSHRAVLLVKSSPLFRPALYLSMGWASHLAAKSLESAVLPSAQDDIHLGMALYYGQLVLNFAWSPLFFMKKQIGVALVDSALMAGTTFYMTMLWHDPSRAATTKFLIPYCAWLSFATYLNGGIWYLNRNTSPPSPS